MPEEESNRTLLDFEASSDDEPADRDEADDEPGTVARDPASVSPAVSTSRFAPDGESCASCESSVRRLWVADVADGDVVCTDCKSW